MVVFSGPVVQNELSVVKKWRPKDAEDIASVCVVACWRLSTQASSKRGPPVKMSLVIRSTHVPRDYLGNPGCISITVA